MQNLKHLILSAFLAFTLFFVMGVGTALAASIYTIDFTTAIVGGASSYEIEYTVDTAEQTWADGDTLTITLPDNFEEWSALTFDVEHDDDMDDDSTNEDAISEGAGNGEYSISSRTLTIKWDLTTWGAVVDDAETIRVYIWSNPSTRPNYVDATSTLTFGGATAAADTDPSGTIDIDVSIGSLSSTNVEPETLGQSETGRTAVTFTSTANLGVSAQILVTFPSGFDLTNVQDGSNPVDCSGITCSNWTITVSGQTVTVTEGGSESLDAGTYSFSINNVTNPYTTGSTGTYTILTKHSSGSNSQTDASVTADTIEAVGSSSAVLANPSNLTITDYEGGGVMLTWDDPSGDDSTHVNIYRGIDPYPVSGTKITAVTIGTGYYIDDEVEEGDVVTYFLRSAASSNTSTGTDEITFTVGSSENNEEEIEANDNDEEAEGTEEIEEEQDSTTESEYLEDLEIPELSDIEGHWAEIAIEHMILAGVVEGNDNGTFKPDKSLNRAAAAALLYRILEDEAPSDVSKNPFIDVSKGEWYAPYVGYLKDLGLITGNPDKTYSPQEGMNRAEFIYAAMAIYEYLNGEVPEVSKTNRYVDLDASKWYAQVVSQATEMGFIFGKKKDNGIYFSPSSNITRAEATVILYRMFGE